MNKMLSVIGINRAGDQVFANEAQAMNNHLCAIGKSGAGKTSSILSKIVNDAENGGVTIVVNWHNCVNRDMIMPELREGYERYCKVIDVAREGMPLPLFDAFTDGSGKKETFSGIVQRVTSLLKVAAKLSPTQEGEVFKAVKTVANQELYKDEGIIAIYDWLMSQDKAVSTNAAAKLRSICGGNLLKNGDFWEEGTKVYEFDLNGLQYDDQLIIVRLLMDYFLRLANTGRFQRTGLNIFLDECQNLDFGEGSTMYVLLNESRRLNVRLRLAAPSISTSGNRNMEKITQCGFCFYFQPIEKDRRKIADFINSRDADTWNFILSRLQKGEFVATGSFIINEKKVNRPLQLKTYIPENLDLKDTFCAR